MGELVYWLAPLNPLLIAHIYNRCVDAWTF